MYKRQHPDVLKSFARHEKTGLPIPEEMLRSLDASRGNTPALALAGQLLYAKMDLAVHTDPERFAAGPLDEVDAAVAGDMDYFKAVSYTHLDVYKRQGTPPESGNFPMMPMAA